MSYGYRVASRDVWEIVPALATIIVRIFEWYVAGVSGDGIAKRLNAEGVPGPDGCAWSHSTIYGWGERGTGILNNALYVSIYIWPKQRFRKSPRTGKRIARPVPEAERGRYPRPHLRIISDELWQVAKARQAAIARTIQAAARTTRKGEGIVRHDDRRTYSLAW